jgi:hypothetical protein
VEIDRTSYLLLSPSIRFLYANLLSPLVSNRGQYLPSTYSFGNPPNPHLFRYHINNNNDTMKLTLVLTLAFTLLVSATPGSNVHNAADVAMVDCEDCKNRYQFCFDVSVLSWGM